MSENKSDWTRHWVVRFITERYEFTKTSVVVTVILGLCCGITYLSMNFMGNVASARSPDNHTTPVLRDAGFENISEIKQLWMTDMFDALTFAPTLILGLLHRKPMSVLCRAFIVSTICNLMRITTVAITSFPDPRLDCIRVDGDPLGSLELHRCGDAMFSGHTVIFVLCAHVWTMFSPATLPFRLATFLMWCLATAGGIIIIANRAHYTVDVLVAFYITSAVFYTVLYFWDLFIVVPGRLKAIVMPHGNLYDDRGRLIMAKPNDNHIIRPDQRIHALDVSFNSSEAPDTYSPQIPPTTDYRRHPNESPMTMV